MASSKRMELAVGVFVVLGVAALLMLALKVSDLTSLREEASYHISAQFDNIGSLKVRATVTVAGVRIGRVSSIRVDPQSYRAVVVLSIENQYNQLPKDTSASILTTGLVGEQYIGLEPGGDENLLKEGDTLKLTQSALVIERLIGHFLTSMDKK